jgi:hypothetical protein
LVKTPKRFFAFIHNRDFCADALFIRAEITVGAQSAQWQLLAYARNCDAGCNITLKQLVTTPQLHANSISGNPYRAC